MSDHKYRVMVTTYSWAECKFPRRNSCHVIEGPKKITFRINYKFNHRNAIFALFVMFPAEKFDRTRLDEQFYEIYAGTRYWELRYTYPRTDFHAFGHPAFTSDESLLIDEEDHL